MTSYGGLTSRARKALKKVPEERNNDDAKILLVGAIDGVTGLNFFFFFSD